MLKAFQALLVGAIVLTSVFFIYEENRPLDLHYYTVDVGPESNSYLLMLDYILAEDATDDQALAVCESIDGVYYPEYDACATDALPLVFMDSTNLGYVYHEIMHN